MGLLSLNNTGSFLQQKPLGQRYRCNGVTQHPPSHLTTEVPWSGVFNLQFAMLGQETDVVQKNRSLPHETSACCVNKYRISVHPWQGIFG